MRLGERHETSKQTTTCNLSHVNDLMIPTMPIGVTRFKGLDKDLQDFRRVLGEKCCGLTGYFYTLKRQLR